MRGIALSLTALVLSACSTALPTATPGVEQVGSRVLRYTGPELDAALSYRAAAGSLGDEWLILDLAVTGRTNAAVEIRRDKVWLRTPAGDTLALPSQETFGRAYTSLRAKVARADIAADPLGYWAGRRDCAMAFLVEPGSTISRLSTWVNDREVCTGRLFFAVPGGIQPGPYVLGIDLEESKVRIPFELPAD
ncbi:MAG: hypothetical protein ACM3O7_11290 [Acidobacteriota bacterium]